MTREETLEKIKKSMECHDRKVCGLAEMCEECPLYVDKDTEYEAHKVLIQALSQEPNRDTEEISEIMKCDADAETKCKMISNILTAKPHYFELSQEPCTDAVSREAIIYYIKGHIHEIITESGTDKNAHTNSILRALINGVETMPPVTQKSGKWIAQQEVNGDDYFKAYDISGVMTYAAKYKCDKCGFIQICIEDHGQYNYCPNCGCRMKGEGK